MRSRLGSSDTWTRLAVAFALAISFGFAIAPHIETVPSDLSVPLWAVPAYLLLLVPYHVCRASRWVALVRPVAPVSWRSGMLVALAGYMWVALLPFRLGELARPLFLQQRIGTPITRSLGSIAVERVVDGLVVCACFFGGLLLLEKPLGDSRLLDGTLVVVSAFAAALVVLVSVACAPSRCQSALEKRLEKLSPRLAQKVAGAMDNIVQGLRGIASAKAVASFLVLTAFYWGANILGMWVLAHGCGLDLTLSASLMVLAIMNVALLVPGGPAQFGIFQTGLVLGLALFLSPEQINARGSVFAFYLYVCQIGSITLVGLLSQYHLRLDWRAVLFARPSANAPRADAPPS